MLSNPHLTSAQQRALALLSAGFTAAAAARSVGVHRNTVANWLRSSIFREALFQARSDQALAWREQAGSLTPQAIGAIQAIMADPQAPAAVRLQAALAIRGPQPSPANRPPNGAPPRPAATSPAPVAVAGNSSAAVCQLADFKSQMGLFVQIQMWLQTRPRCTKLHNYAQNAQLFPQHRRAKLANPKTGLFGAYSSRLPSSRQRVVILLA
jgi:hypothetical protein